MHTIGGLINQKLWEQYARLNPQVKAIHRLLEERGERVVNDHIALRTYNDPRVGLEVLARPFIQLGYQPRGEYSFSDKKLRARHFELDADPAAPKIFISELELEKCSADLRQTAAELIDQIPSGTTDRWDLPAMGRPWKTSYEQYERLRKESEYAAWVAAFGYMANHFTVLVNALRGFESLEVLNSFLKQQGFALNAGGGEIKGSPEVYLEQSSTLADKIPVEFSDRVHSVPCCYYEFARRYSMPDGKLYQGFVEKSADKIFESTNKR
jgi:Domain of unknown function (DUF1338)